MGVSNWILNYLTVSTYTYVNYLKCVGRKIILHLFHISSLPNEIKVTTIFRRKTISRRRRHLPVTSQILRWVVPCDIQTTLFLVLTRKLHPSAFNGTFTAIINRCQHPTNLSMNSSADAQTYVRKYSNVSPVTRIYDFLCTGTGLKWMVPGTATALDIIFGHEIKQGK